MSDSDKPPAEDVVLVGGPSESGEGLNVLRKRNDTIELGELRAAQEGKPLTGELVRLKRRPGAHRLFDVEVLYDARRPEERRPDAIAPERSGPPQVATDAYRANWDAVFGKRRGKGSQAN